MTELESFSGLYNIFGDFEIFWAILSLKLYQVFVDSEIVLDFNISSDFAILYDWT